MYHNPYCYQKISAADYDLVFNAQKSPADKDYYGEERRGDDQKGNNKVYWREYGYQRDRNGGKCSVDEHGNYLTRQRLALAFLFYDVFAACVQMLASLAQILQIHYNI